MKRSRKEDLDFFLISLEASFTYANCSPDSEESLLRTHLLVLVSVKTLKETIMGAFKNGILGFFPGICSYNYGLIIY